MEFVLRIIELAAVFACAISATVEARAKQMDLVGVYFVAMATALGGGTLRDLLLDRKPVFWIADPRYPLYVLAFALIAILMARRSRETDPRLVRLVAISDAIGLGLFSIAGATYSLDAKAGSVIAVLIGVTNGIFGGVVRDILCNQVPAVFRSNTQLYATCSFIGCVTYLCLMGLGIAQGTCFTLGILATFAIRLIAMRFKIGLPI